MLNRQSERGPIGRGAAATCIVDHPVKVPAIGVTNRDFSTGLRSRAVGWSLPYDIKLRLPMATGRNLVAFWTGIPSRTDDGASSKRLPKQSSTSDVRDDGMIDTHGNQTLYTASKATTRVRMQHRLSGSWHRNSLSIMQPAVPNQTLELGIPKMHQ